MKIIRAWKYRLYPSKKQKELLNHQLWLSKELWNEMLAECKKKYSSDGLFPSKTELREIVKNRGIYSQVAQELVDRLLDAIKRKLKMRNKAGFPRFKNFSQMKSLVYPQSGFSLEKKLKLSPIGEIQIKKHRELMGRIRTLTIKREPSCKFFAIFTTELEISQEINLGSSVGIDLGLMNFAAFSDGTIIKNPKHLQKLEDKLIIFQKRLSAKKKGSKNRVRARLKVAKIHEKIANARNDFLHKLSTKLVFSYSMLALEKLNSHDMAKEHGKSINDAAWNKFTHMLSYKAESAGSKVVLVDPRNTSKECSRCGKITDKHLYERLHKCNNCGLSLDRDVNAAKNILMRATPGTGVSKACGEEVTASCKDEQTFSMKQEAHGFSRG